MATCLTLHLLGPMSATLEDGERVEFAYEKVRALLAYLAIEHDRPHPRARLATLLWPEKSESAARHSLSQALSVLRQAIGDRDRESPILEVRQDTIRFNLRNDCWVDLIEFNRLLAEVDRHEHGSDGCSECLVQRERAARLYRGPFLAGFSLPDSPAFEDWLRSQEQAASRALDGALRALIEGLEQAGDQRHASEFAQRLVDLDPWDEGAHRTLMRLLAASGRRAAALRQFELCRASLEAELGVEPEDETVRLYERIRSGLEGPTSYDSTSVPAGTPRSTLPVNATSFVGREDEIEQIRHLISSDQTRIVTLTGPGGIGKTRLAIRVAETLVDEFPDGVHFVSLAGLSTSDLVPSTILSALSAEADWQADPREQLVAYVQHRKMLLLLDNFEHLVSGALLIADLIEAAPELRILVTSRQRLSLSGEWVYEVEGLTCPVDGSSTAIATSGAARLFMLNARKHKASFLPSPQEGPAIASICNLTGGMPLALELAAAWIPVLTPSEIAREIELSLDFLASSMRDLPERHRSIRAILERSWENLTEVEQRAFRRLSVFHGGFSRTAASYVSGTSLPILSALVSKSFLRRDNHGRYAIHELLRQYGTAKLKETDGEATVVNDRHRDYFIGFLAVREEQLEGKSQVAVLGEISSEIENIRAAWQRSVDTHDIEGICRATHAAWLFYEITGKYREGLASLGAAYSALHSLETVPEEQRALHQFTVGRLRAREAATRFRLMGSNAMHEHQSEALRLVSQSGNQAEIGLILNFLAVAAHAEADHATEERYLCESIEHFERAGHRWGMAYSMNDLGQLRALQRDFVGARDLHQSALGMLEELGDRRGIAFALRHLGIVASHLGDRELALALLRRSVDVRRSIGNQWGIAESLHQVGVILRDGGQPDQAARHFREALQIARDIRSMQLAREILDAILPMLSPDTARPQSQARLPAFTSETATAAEIKASAEATGWTDIDELSRLVDRVLDGLGTTTPPQELDAAN